MKAIEIRIGNYILINGDPVNIGYGVIQDMAQKDKGISNKYLESMKHEPILLTPEIIEKCGFEKISETNPLFEPYWRKRFISLWEVGGDPNQYTPAIKGDFIAISIKTVHELQNIFFALTQTELTYTP